MEFLNSGANKLNDPRKMVYRSTKARENGASEAELLRLSSDLWEKMDPDNLRQQYEDAYAAGMKKDMKRLILILAGILIITAVWQFARF